MADQIDPSLDPQVQQYLASRRARQEAQERKLKPSFRTVPKNFKYAWRLVWRSGRALVVTVIVLRVFTQLVASGLILIAPGAIGGIRAEGFTLAGLMQLLPFFAVFAINSLFSSGTSQMQEYLNAKVQKTITDEVLDVAASVDLASYESPQFFDHLQRVENNALVAPVQLSQTILQLGPGLIGLVTATAALLFVEPLVLPVLLASIIPFVLIARAATKREFEFAKLRTLSDRQRAYLRSVLIGKDEAKEVRAFGSGGYLRSQYEKRYEDFLVYLRSQSRRRILINWLMMMATIGAVASWIGAVIFLYITKRTGFEELGAAAVAAPILVTRFATVGGAIAQTLQASIFLDDLNDFLGLKKSDTPEEGAERRRATPKISEIQIDSVHFSYPGTEAEALRGVTLNLKPGEVVALVGENGSGKTTLAKIIGQLYRPSSGRVLVNGIDAEELDSAELRKQIAIIFQDFVRYQLTASQNVALGDTSHVDDMPRVESAVDQAGARDFLERLPEKYETILSKAFPGGADLSIGQWQRVALARAFFRDAPFIILDEPTAALDARAEYHLFERLRELRRGRTLLLISHRFSTVRSADHIYVLNEGEIIEHGSHEELIRNEGLYAELFNLQTSVDLQPIGDEAIGPPLE